LTRVRRPCIIKRASTYIRSMMSILSICVAALTIQVRCQWWYCCVQVYNLRVQLNIKYMVKPIDQLFLVRKWQAKQFLSRRPGLLFFCCCHAASHTSTLPWPLVSLDRRTISKHKKKGLPKLQVPCQLLLAVTVTAYLLPGHARSQFGRLRPRSHW